MPHVGSWPAIKRERPFGLQAGAQPSEPPLPVLGCLNARTWSTLISQVTADLGCEIFYEFIFLQMSDKD